MPSFALRTAGAAVVACVAVELAWAVYLGHGAAVPGLPAMAALVLLLAWGAPAALDGAAAGGTRRAVRLGVLSVAAPLALYARTAVDGSLTSAFPPAGARLAIE